MHENIFNNTFEQDAVHKTQFLCLVRNRKGHNLPGKRSIPYWMQPEYKNFVSPSCGWWKTPSRHIAGTAETLLTFVIIFNYKKTRKLFLDSFLVLILFLNYSCLMCIYIISKYKCSVKNIYQYRF